MTARLALARFTRASRWVTFRLRLQAGVDAAAGALPWTLAGAVGALFADALSGGAVASSFVLQPSALPAPAVGLAVALALAVGLTRAGRRLPPLAGAVRLDTHHGLRDRLAGALAFEALPPDERTPLMELAIDQAKRSVAAFRPSDAAPLRAPGRRLLGILATLTLGALVASSLHAARWMERWAELPAPPPRGEALLSRDEAAALAARADRAVEEASPELRVVAREVRRLAQAARALERRDFFRQEQALRQRLHAMAVRGATDERAKDRLVRTLGDLAASVRANGQDAGRAGRLDGLAGGRGLPEDASPIDPLDSEPPPPPPPPEPGTCRGPSGGAGGEEGDGESDRGSGLRDEPEPEKASGVAHDDTQGPGSKGMRARVDVRAPGKPSAGGKVRSATVRAAAVRGFRADGYEDAFRAYEQKVESGIDRERVPPGMGFYVRGYFDRIRPE